jgi:general stress protein 26
VAAWIERARSGLENSPDTRAAYRAAAVLATGGRSPWQCALVFLRESRRVLRIDQLWFAASRRHGYFAGMSSIHQNQPEDQCADLSGQAAVAKIKQLVDDAKSCFFCTEVATVGTTHARPMNVRKVDDAGNLWFLSSDDSHKNEELLHDPRVRLYFQGSAHSDFLELSGMASVSKDEDMIRELWEPVLKTWFTEGVDDPRITVIKVKPLEGYYWDTKHGSAVAGVKMLIGAMLGTTLDDSIEGRLRV